MAKLNPTGTGLVYSTYLGGTNYDYGYGVAVDGDGNAYITGSTYVHEFPYHV
ncbi:MAG: SBBP repeat-containing protein [Methanobacterium sp.]